MTVSDDRDMLAAEYALGTLDHDERRAVTERRARDPELDAAIVAWEARLAPLSARAAPAEPAADLLPDIEARIARRRSQPPEDPGVVPELARLRARVARWRAAALVSLAAAAGLAGLLIVPGPVVAPGEQRFVAVFQENDRPPEFLLSIDLATRELTIRPIAAEPPQGKDYQLWIVAEPLGPKPRTLGLLDMRAGATRRQLDELAPEALRKATFGISLEPPGGSPTGQPTGPAIHSTLIPVEP